MAEIENVQEERLRTTFEGFEELLRLQEKLLEKDIKIAYTGEEHPDESITYQYFQTMVCPPSV